MEFMVNTGEKELSVVAWLLQQKSGKNTGRKILFYSLGIIFFILAVYLYVAEDKSLIQISLMLLIGIACLIKPNLKTIQDYDAKADKKNKAIQNQQVLYRFFDTHIEAATVLSTNRRKWKKCKGWGEKNGCIYILLKGGSVIILDESKYAEEKIFALKNLLVSKVNGKDNCYEICDENRKSRIYNGS